MQGQTRSKNSKNRDTVQFSDNFGNNNWQSLKEFFEELYYVLRILVQTTDQKSKQKQFNNLEYFTRTEEITNSFNMMLLEIKL